MVAALVEAATEVAAEATVAESTRSIQLNPAKSKRARLPNATVGSVSSYPSVQSIPVFELYAKEVLLSEFPFCAFHKPASRIQG